MPTAVVSVSAPARDANELPTSAAVERGVDVRRPLRRTARYEFGRRSRAGAEHEGKRSIARGERFDQRQRDAAFADAGGVEPDNNAARPGLRREVKDEFSDVPDFASLLASVGS